MVAVIVFATLVGCASQRANGPEQQLAAAGFQIWYADTDGCKCVYAGNRLAYDEYQRMAAGDMGEGPGVMAAKINKDAAMDWGVRGS
jgi:hypothetical protein